MATIIQALCIPNATLVRSDQGGEYGVRTREGAVIWLGRDGGATEKYGWRQ